MRMPSESCWSRSSYRINASNASLISLICLETHQDSHVNNQSTQSQSQVYFNAGSFERNYSPMRFFFPENETLQIGSQGGSQFSRWSNLPGSPTSRTNPSLIYFPCHLDSITDRISHTWIILISKIKIHDWVPVSGLQMCVLSVVDVVVADIVEIFPPEVACK